jgi:hypothetical protein
VQATPPDVRNPAALSELQCSLAAQCVGTEQGSGVCPGLWGHSQLSQGESTCWAHVEKAAWEG